MYEKLYDVVASNYLNAGKEIKYLKSTYLCDVGKHPQVIDVSEYLHLPNVEFAQSIFVTTFRRLPEGKECSKWNQMYELEKEEFQKLILRQVVNSSVVAINKIQFVNNPYFIQKRGLRYKAMGLLYGLTDKSFLREFGKKLPQPIQKIIRKVFL